MTKPGKKENRLQEQSQESITGIDHTGDFLRKLRTEKGLSVKEACEATRISLVNLEALENLDFAALPAETFTRGLLTIYARYLGVDPAPVVARFMRERGQNQGGGKRGKARQAVQHQILTPKKLAEPAQISSITMAAILLVAIVALFTGFCLYTSWNPFGFLLSGKNGPIESAVMQALPAAPAEQTGKESASSPAAAATADAPSPASSDQAPVAQAPPATPSAPGAATSASVDSVSVEFLKDTQLVITQDNKPPVTTRHKKGEKQSWPGAASMQLTFDQPASATVLVHGQPVAFPAETGGRYTLHLPADLSQPSSRQ